MKRGDRYTILEGHFKGVPVIITSMGKPMCKGRVVSSGSDDYRECGDGCCSLDDNETIEFDTPRDPLEVIDQQIKETATTLRGLMLKRKDITNPASAKKEISRLLACVKL